MDSIAAQWLDRISRAKRRKGEKNWRKKAQEAVEIYEGDRQERIAFNILYSNTETLVPSLYSATPRPVVERRYKDADPVGKAAATVGQRIAEYCLDTNDDEYQPFDDAMTEAVIDAAVPGRGVTRVRYDADIYDKLNDSPPLLNDETVCYESVAWDRIVFGYAKKWVKVPWIAFAFDIEEDESKELFGAAVTAKLTFTEHTPQSNEDSKDSENNDDADVDSDAKTARIYEIWDRKKKEIVFVADCWTDDILKTDDDPKQFSGFFPIPEPLRFLRKSNNQLPTTLYSMYENQAKELDRITQRINKIVEAIKVRGVYDPTIAEIENLFDQDDNKLVPAQNAAALQDSGGLEKGIWLAPIEKYVAVLQQLYVAREACKSVIYEITGIADIMRGNTKASETLGAQEIKSQWGTLRLKKMQKDVQRYACDLIRMTIEVGAKSLTLPTIMKMTGLPFPTKKLQEQAQQAVMIMQQSGQQPPPEAVAALAAPAWEDIMAMLKDKTLRQYRIDIETNSTVDPAATEDKQDLTALMSALAQFMSGVAPLVESGSMPFEAAKAVLLLICRQYPTQGSKIEDIIEQMQPPQPQTEQPDQSKEIQAQFALGSANAKVQQLEIEKKDLEKKVQLGLKEVDLNSKEADLQRREDMLNMKSQMAMKELELSQKGHMNEVQTTVEKAKVAQTAQLGVEKEKIGKEVGKVKTEAAGQKAQASVLQAFSKTQMKMLEEVLKAHGETQKGIMEIVKAMSAPRELVRDAKGRASGTRIAGAA